MQRLGVLTTRWILDGLPGCEKTSLVKKNADMNNHRFVSIFPADFYRCYVSVAERIIVRESAYT